jgi:hypothetical protein
MNKLKVEDSLLERKTESYSPEDFLRTFVAFANSVRPGETAIVLIGEDNDGDAVGLSNPDAFQIKIRKIVDKIYPAIDWRSETYEKDGHTCLRVEIKFSGDTPHFGGGAWVRKGSESVKAPDEMFQKLIELRLDKVRELNKWIGKSVTVEFDYISTGQPYHVWSSQPSMYGVRWSGSQEVELRAVNSHWVELQRLSDQITVSEPLQKLVLSYDFEANRLKLTVQA